MNLQFTRGMKELLTMNTKNIHKNIINTNYGRWDCVSDKTHPLICKHNLSTSNNTLPIINRLPFCKNCFLEVQEGYNQAVNDGFAYSMEVYVDSYVRNKLRVLQEILQA